jgi:hypothetical protein
MLAIHGQPAFAYSVASNFCPWVSADIKDGSVLFEATGFFFLLRNTLAILYAKGSCTRDFSDDRSRQQIKRSKTLMFSHK